MLTVSQTISYEDLATEIAQAYEIPREAFLLTWNLGVSTAFVDPLAFYNDRLQAISAPYPTTVSCENTRRGGFLATLAADALEEEVGRRVRKNWRRI